MLASALRMAAEETEPSHVELPLSPLGYGLTALGIFLGLLAVTWAFRSVANRH